MSRQHPQTTGTDFHFFLAAHCPHLKGIHVFCGLSDLLHIFSNLPLLSRSWSQNDTVLHAGSLQSWFPLAYSYVPSHLAPVLTVMSCCLFAVMQAILFTCMPLSSARLQRSSRNNLQHQLQSKLTWEQGCLAPHSTVDQLALGLEHKQPEQIMTATNTNDAIKARHSCNAMSAHFSFCCVSYLKLCCVCCRLNFRLTQACGEVLKEVCTNVCLDEENVDKACGGTVLRCLADKIDDITDDGCKSELLYFQKMEVGFFWMFCGQSYFL